jgi:transposase
LISRNTASGVEAHGQARELIALGHTGHTVKLMPPAYVKAYVKRNKYDAADAEAICEAATRPSMRFMPIKNAEQQSVLMRCWSTPCAPTWPNSASLRRRVCGTSRC